MFESLRPRRGTSVPAEEPDQPAPALAQQPRRHLLEVAYATGAAAGVIAWLVIRTVSEPAGATFGTYVGQPYILLGILVFGGRALARERLRWCRVCRRWSAMEWKGERVLHRRPFMQTRKTFTETFNVRGEKISTSRQRSTSRAVRETVDVEQVCRYCGAVRTFRETRDR
jgi:hypothetical protein